MSRIGKIPITIPSGVTIEVTNELIKVKGPKGELQEKIVPEVIFREEENAFFVESINTTKRAKQMHGLYRQLVFNMVEGVSKGISKTLQMIGVGYRAEEKKGIIGLNIGYSTQFEYVIPEDVSITVEKQTTLIVSGISKQRVGQIAAEIRSIRPPEPYKGKGIKYSDEIIRRKEGKTGKK